MLWWKSHRAGWGTGGCKTGIHGCAKAQLWRTVLSPPQGSGWRTLNGYGTQCCGSGCFGAFILRIRAARCAGDLKCSGGLTVTSAQVYLLVCVWCLLAYVEMDRALINCVNTTSSQASKEASHISVQAVLSQPRMNFKKKEEAPFWLSQCHHLLWVFNFLYPLPH